MEMASFLKLGEVCAVLHSAIQQVLLKPRILLLKLSIMPSYRTVHVHTLSTDFRAATEIVVVPELPTASEGHIVVKNHYVGINATDINITSGFYGNTTTPFGCGLEAGAKCL